MNIFIYSTHTLWPHHAETELELIQLHLDKDDNVYRFVCNGELPVCDTNVHHRLYSCFKCIDKQKIGQSLVDGKETIIVNSIYSSEHYKKAKEIVFDFTDLKKFKEFRIDNFDIGYAVSSSIISELRDPSPDIEKNIQLFTNYFYSSLAIYFAALDHFAKFKPDVIYAFNGRVAHGKPILRAAQKTGIECRIHERGCDIFHYGITVNTTPHDIDNFTVQMEKLWEQADLIEREKVGASFYEERIRGKEQAWVSFVKDQQSDLLPADWNKEKRNIAIFNTSEDEYESIGPEWKNELYETQAEGIEKLLNSFADKTNFHFYLRIHPNLKGLDNRQIRDAYLLKKYPNLTIIDAESPVSTYTLMMEAEKTVTFGSSAGIEAVYWGKVSVLLGKSFYSFIEGAYKPKTHEETVEMISSVLQPSGKTGALKYGYYLKNFGYKFVHYKPTGLLSGTFKNVDLDLVASTKTKLFKKLHSLSVFNSVYRMTRTSANNIQRILLKW